MNIDQNAFLVSQVTALQVQLTRVTTERDTAVSDLAEAYRRIDSLLEDHGKAIQAIKDLTHERAALMSRISAIRDLANRRH